jgi:hypothetical protein
MATIRGTPQYLSPILETNYNTTNLLKSKSKLDTYEGYTQYNLKNVEHKQ